MRVRTVILPVVAVMLLAWIVAPRALAQRVSRLPSAPQSAPSMVEGHTIQAWDGNTVGVSHTRGVILTEHEEPETPWHWELIELAPTFISQPAQPLAQSFEHIFGGKHDRLHTELDSVAIGIQPIPQRPPLLFEWNEGFLANGPLAHGIQTHTGAIWRPALWVFGEYRSAVQYADLQRPGDPVAEWAHRWDLFTQLNLSGTERVLMQFRPFDEEEGSVRRFSGYDFRNGDSFDGSNFRFNTMFFEGDFGEVFPRLDPFDTRALDYGFAVGRMPLLAQQGLLINEDVIDAVTVTRNTLNAGSLLNLRMTAVYAWDNINRNSPFQDINLDDGNSRMVALLTESDFAHSTVNFDATFVFSNAAGTGDLAAFGWSSIQRHHLFHNTYNTSLHVLASYPTSGRTMFADQGELLFAQTSWTPHGVEDLIYVNGFWAIDQFTSPARGTLAAGPLGQTGVLYSAPGIGALDAPLGARTNNRAGGSVGYQFFYDHTRQQVIFEIGGHAETKGDNTGALGAVIRWQRAFGQHYILLMDGFAAKRESENISPGFRAELRMKY
ncbi:MAG: hypothetical protein MPJ50_01340 [Pirellulales bacterium]|nr:hypothetical protein [Pirellulales bacterium]